MMERTKIAFLGLGVMGSRMAARLLAAGYPLSVYNRRQRKLERWSKAERLWQSLPPRLQPALN